MLERKLSSFFFLSLLLLVLFFLWYYTSVLLYASVHKIRICEHIYINNRHEQILFYSFLVLSATSMAVTSFRRQTNNLVLFYSFCHYSLFVLVVVLPVAACKMKAIMMTTTCCLTIKYMRTTAIVRRERRERTKAIVVMA